MKKSYLLSTVLAVAVVAAGCQKTETPADDSTTGSTNSVSDSIKSGTSNIVAGTENIATNAWAKTKEVTTNAWENLKESLQPTADYTYDKKDAFVADAQADLTAMDAKIQALSDKAASATDSVKTEAQAKLKDLQAQRTVLDQKLNDVKASTEAGWDTTKTAFVTAYGDTTNSLKQAWEWLKSNT